MYLGIKESRLLQE